MNSPNWASVFGLTENDLADLENHLSGSDHPLRWLLLNGHIESTAYTRWARDEYGLPSLKDEYFGIPADLVYWEAVKHLFKWTPHFFPLTEWQGVMLIACLQPPDFHFPIHAPHRFVIASAHALEQRFRQLEPQTMAPTAVELAPVVEETYQEPAYQEPTDQEPAYDESSHEPMADIPPSHAPSAFEAEHEQDVEFTAAEPVAVSTSQVRQRPADEVMADSLPAAPDVDMRDPEGLVFDIDSSSSIDFMVPDGMQIAAIPQAVSSVPDGLGDFSGINDMSDFSDDEPQPVAVAAAAPAPAPAPAVAAAPKIATPVTAPVEPPRAPVVPPGPPAGVVKATAEKFVMPPAPPPTPMALRSNVSSTEPAVPLATCTSIDSLMAAAVAHICVYFQHAMVLNYDNAVLKPMKWSELLLSTKGDSPDAISLENASVFRVAARTSLPYHGYVVSNPTNALFFNAFNRGQLPKHVTIMPVMIAGQLTAMLAGLSNEVIDYKGTLNAMEKLASDFSTQLERLRERQQAA